MHEYLVFTNCSKYLTDQANSYGIKLRLFGFRRWGLGALSALIWIVFHRKVRIRDLASIYTSYVGSLASDTIVFLLLMRYLFRVPYVLHIHGGGMLPWKPHFLHKALFRNASRIAGVSERICNEYTNRSERKVDLLLPIMPFIEPKATGDLLRSKLGFNAYGAIILYVGSMKPLKAPNILLDAFMNLDESIIDRYNPALLFCGDGVLREELMNLKSKSSYSSRIHFAGNIDNEEISNYYAIADIYVMPSWFEGTPIALMQAMKMGLTAIGTNVNGISNLISHGETGLLFEKDDSEGLTNLLQSVLDGQYDRKQMHNNAIEAINLIHNYDLHLDQMSNYISLDNDE